MNQTSTFGLCLTMALAVAGVLTTGSTQTTLFIVSACAAAALVLAALIDYAGKRARDKALGK